MSKYCPKCNQIQRDGDMFCMNCGTPYQEQKPAIAQNPTPVQSVLLKDNKAVQSTPASPIALTATETDVSSKTPVATASNTSSGMNTFFVKTDEKPRYSLRNGYIANFVGMLELKTNDAVITDKRVYFNAASWKNLTKSRTEMIVDLEDITGTMICRVRSYGMLILSILLALVVTFIAIFFPNGGSTLMGAACACGLVSIVLFLLWLFMNVLTKRTLFKIEYAGGGNGGMFGQSGSMNFDVNMYSLKSVKEFQNEIYRAKDELKKSRN